MPGTVGYLKMAMVCDEGEKVFLDEVLLLLVVLVEVGCEEWYGCCGRKDRGGLMGGE